MRALSFLHRSWLRGLLIAAFLMAAWPSGATVSTTASSVVYQGNGVTTVWSYSFPIPNAGDVVIQVTNTTVTPPVVTTLTPSQYTITGLGTSTGGNVTYPISGSPIAAGYTLAISRIVPLVQTTSLCNQGATFCAIESALDYLTYIAQQIQTQITNLTAGTIVVGYQVPNVSRVTGGSSTTVSSNLANQAIVWASATTSAKTTTLYGCATGFSGYTVAVTDAQGTAATYNVTITPSSGTINGASSLVMSVNNESVTAVCDGNTNWVIQ